jgi:hypothetical protein
MTARAGSPAAAAGGGAAETRTAEVRRLPGAREAAAAGLLVAVLDGAFALLVYVVVLRAATPARVFQAIAAGVLGPDAFAGGGATAALGVALHAGIACAWAAAFVLAVRRVAALRRAMETVPGAVAAGAAYGVLVWLAMSRVVVPLAGMRTMPVASALFATMLLGHVAVVGLPIALTVRGRAARGG